MSARTDDLIRSLSEDLAPVPRRMIERRLALGLGLGALATLGILSALLGFRADLGVAITGFAFWMKLAYTLSLAIIAIVATARLARPDWEPRQEVRLLAAPVFLLGAIALAQGVQAPRAAWVALWLGHSWRVCSTLVFGLSLPIFLGLLWAFQRFAPTRPVVAGAAAGFASGAFAASIYCLHCPETSAGFVLIWYTLGMVLAAALGGATGSRLLRW